MQFYMLTLLEILCKKAWVYKIIYPSVKSLISLFGVQEILGEGNMYSFFLKTYILKKWNQSKERWKRDDEKVH